MAQDQPSLEVLGDALVGEQLRRMEARIMNRLDSLAAQVSQQAVDEEALAEALDSLKASDQTIDQIEPEEPAP
jgi:hypothetical protein